MSFIQVAALRGAIALHRGNLPIADDHLHRALTQARELGLADEEASVLILLADRRLREEQTDIARQHIADADPLIERGQLRLRRVDSLNMLSRIEYACGDNASAARAAADAWRAAWCDGPPFAYAEGLRQARENLALAGAPEPADLPRTAPSAADLALSPLSTQDVVNLANSETDESERQLPVEALLRRGMADDVDALRWLVLEASEQTRSLVITRAARSYLGESDVGRELWRRLVSDGDRAGLAAAMEMLNQTPSDGAVQLLTRLAASDPSATVRAAAREALASHRRRFDVR